MSETKKRPGRPPGKTMPCGWGCGAELTAVQIREHFTSCPNRDKPKGIAGKIRSRLTTTTLGRAKRGASTTAVVSAGGTKQSGPVVLVDAENPAAVEFEKRIRKPVEAPAGLSNSQAWLRKNK